MSTGQHNDARIYGVIGASGSGKSLHVKTVLLKPTPKRLLIWNPQAEQGYSDLCTTVTTSLSTVAKTARNQTFLIDYQPDTMANLADQFATFCHIAYLIPDCVVVVEELSGVTKASYAPPEWNNICSRGRHKGIVIIGIAQRPSQVDKTFFSQCTTLRTGRLNFRGDQKVMADALSSSPIDVGNLKPLQYIQKDMASGVVTTGFIKLPKNFR